MVALLGLQLHAALLTFRTSLMSPMETHWIWVPAMSKERTSPGSATSSIPSLRWAPALVPRSGHRDGPQ